MPSEMHSPLLPIVLVRVDDATDCLFDEESVDGLGRRKETAGFRGTSEVLIGEEMKDGEGKRVYTVLRVVGHLDIGKSMLQERGRV